MASEKLNKLNQKKNAVLAEIRKEETRIARKQRNDDTRRKILAGAFVMDRASRDEQYNGWLVKSLDGFLIRPDDRALFGLPAVPAPAAPVDNQDAAENQ